MGGCIPKGGVRGKEQSAAGFELTPGISADGSQDGLKLESFTAATAGPANLLTINVKADQIGASLARSLNAQHVEKVGELWRSRRIKWHKARRYNARTAQASALHATAHHESESVLQRMADQNSLPVLLLPWGPGQQQRVRQPKP